jgi:4-amino-4-deoxy-L-arabinose transferase-like glycosyltransferase
MTALLGFVTGRVGLPLAMLAAALALRSLSFVPAVIDTDEGLYTLQAREWLAGTWPLIGVWDMHPIGAPALAALAMLLPLPVIFAVRLLGTIAVAATATALTLLARTLGLPPLAAFSAGLLSIALTTNFGGLATNTEILFAPFAVGALVIAAREAARALDEDETPRMGAVIAAGLLIGVALTIKSIAVLEGCFAFAVIAGAGLAARTLPPRRLGLLALTYTAACGLPTLLLAIAYAVQGALGLFVDVWFLAPLRYVGARIAVRDGAWMVVSVILFLAWPFALAAATLLPDARVARAARFGAVWLVVAALAVAAPGMFFNHYFLIILPPLSLLAAAGAWALAQRLRPARPVWLLGLIVAAMTVNAWVADAARRIETGPGFRKPDPVRLVAEAVREAVPEGAAVWIANYHPVVYVLADVAVPTRYAFPAHLAGWYSGVTGIDADAEIDRVLATRPAAIVVDRGWWSAIRPPIRGVIEAALAQDYVFAARVLEANGPVEIWRLRDPA